MVHSLIFRDSGSQDQSKGIECLGRESLGAESWSKSLRTYGAEPELLLRPSNVVLSGSMPDVPGSPVKQFNRTTFEGPGSPREGSLA